MSVLIVTSLAALTIFVPMTAQTASKRIADVAGQITREGVRLGPAIGGWLSVNPERGKAILQQSLPMPGEDALELAPQLSWRNRMRSWLYMALDYDITQPTTLLAATLPHTVPVNTVVRLPGITSDTSTNSAATTVTQAETKSTQSVPPTIEPKAEPTVNVANETMQFSEELEGIKYAKSARLTGLAQTDWGDQPLVLIFHTHTSEMYRTSDFTPATSDQSHRFNTADTGVVRVGEVLARTLSEKYGIPVVHSKAIHDFPSHAHSYTNAARTVRSLLAKYPSIQVVLDVHRDAAENATYVREVGGTQISQVMVVVSKLGETKPSLHPNWQNNMRFAQGLEQTMQALYPGMLRHYPPVSARYNQNLQKNMVLLEFGNYQDDEKYALRSAAMYADVVAMMLDTVRKNSTRTAITPQSLRKTNPVSPNVEQPAPLPDKPVPSQKQPAPVKQPTITPNTTVREMVQPTIKKPAPSQKRP